MNVEGIIDLSLAQLDAENSGRYTWTNDFQPAFNNLQSWLLSLFEKMYAKDKVSEEMLRELAVAELFVANSHSNVDLSSITNLSSVLAVIPDVVDRFGIGDKASARRLTVEEWGKRKKNMFVAGSDYGNDVGYAYMSPLRFEGTSTIYIPISPDVSNKKVGIIYTQVPSTIDVVQHATNVAYPATITTIPFVENIISMATAKVLQFITSKEIGELHVVVDKEVEQAISML